jgi:hypothetical protein
MLVEESTGIILFKIKQRKINCFDEEENRNKNN